jgi:hypothetical protein
VVHLHTLFDTKAMTTMYCPDQETFELAIKLHDKLRYNMNGTDDDIDLVSLLDCLIQDERTRLWEQRWDNSQAVH